MSNSSSPTPSGQSRPPRPRGQQGRQWEASPDNGHIPGYPKPEDGGPVGPGWNNPQGRDNQWQSGNGSKNQGSPNPGMPPELPKPPKVGRPDGLAPSLKGAPENVRLGVRAWLAVSGLQILYALVQFAANLSDDRDLRRTVTKTIEEGAGVPDEVTENVSIDTLVLGTNALTTAWLVIAALICAWLTLRAGRGAVYSRMFLNVGSVYLMLTAVLMSLSSGPSTMAVGFVLALGVLSILAGVTAGVGMWFMSRPGNEEWFGIPSREEVERYAEEYEQARCERDKHKSGKKRRIPWGKSQDESADSEDKA